MNLRIGKTLVDIEDISKVEASYMSIYCYTKNRGTITETCSSSKEATDRLDEICNLINKAKHADVSTSVVNVPNERLENSAIMAKLEELDKKLDIVLKKLL